MDYQTYKTRKAARAHIETMRGWIARPVEIVDSDQRGMWVIECRESEAETRQPRYLRDDGYVR